MPFAKGHKLSKGRPKGTVNKVTRLAKEVVIDIVNENSPKVQAIIENYLDENHKDYNPKLGIEVWLKLVDYVLPRKQMQQLNIETKPIRILQNNPFVDED